MEIITTYFANLRNAPQDYVHVSIARSYPTNIRLQECVVLAPSASLLADYKNGLITWADYAERYTDETLRKLDPYAFVLSAFERFGPKVVFACWEGKNKHCHRHLAREWFSPYVSCREL